MVWYGLLAQPRNRKRAAQKLIVCRHNQVKVDLDKKEAIKALQRNTSKEEPKMLEWIPNTLSDIDDQNCVQKQGASI